MEEEEEGVTWPAMLPMAAQWIPPADRSKFMSNMMGYYGSLRVQRMSVRVFTTWDRGGSLRQCQSEMKLVKGYDYSNCNGFMFDVHLSYKLKLVISQYSDGKPTLVFCSTRKSVLATAEVLAKSITFSFTETQKEALARLCNQIVDNKIRDLAKFGIGCHHAGLVMTDRNLLEAAFRDSLLPVLIATSTLAMGVNLPAYLVVIKGTQFYGNGGYQDYSDSQLLQMMGRAGRPQFDTSAVAVIMTKPTCE
ncbi:hypothetical protein FOCC_FOCC014201, partial [Frankliniella occidentalis]